MVPMLAQVFLNKNCSGRVKKVWKVVTGESVVKVYSYPCPQNGPLLYRYSPLMPNNIMPLPLTLGDKTSIYGRDKYPLLE